MLRSQQLEALAQQEHDFDKAMMLLLQSHDATLAEEEQEMGLSNLSPGQQILHDLRLANAPIEPLNPAGTHLEAKRAKLGVLAEAKEEAPDSHASAATRKQANFARNAAKWHKGPEGMANTPLDEAASNPPRTSRRLEEHREKDQTAFRKKYRKNAVPLRPGTGKVDWDYPQQHPDQYPDQGEGMNNDLATLDNPVSIEGIVPGEVGTCPTCQCAPCKCPDPSISPSSQRS